MREHKMLVTKRQVHKTQKSKNQKQKPQNQKKKRKTRTSQKNRNKTSYLSKTICEYIITSKKNVTATGI